MWTKVDAAARPPERRHVAMSERVTLAPQAAGTHAIHQDVTLLSASSGDTPLFALYKPHSVLVSDLVGTIPYDRETAVRTAAGPPGALNTQSQAWAMMRARPRASCAEPSPGRLRRSIRRRRSVSFPSQRIRDLAWSVLKDRGIEPDPRSRSPDEDMVAARTLRGHVERRATYTLDIMTAPPGVDPTEWFCFEAKKGHCEYFASALAAMCRSVGIDSRGWSPDTPRERSTAPTSTTNRASAPGARTRTSSAPPTAHAGVEGRVAPDRWITLDATPPSELTRIASPPATLNGRFCVARRHRERLGDARGELRQQAADRALWSRRAARSLA